MCYHLFARGVTYSESRLRAPGSTDINDPSVPRLEVHGEDTTTSISFSLYLAQKRSATYLADGEPPGPSGSADNPFVLDEGEGPAKHRRTDGQ